MGIEQIGFANAVHNALYYKVAAAVFPIILVAVARAAKLRWPPSTAAAAYLAGFRAQIPELACRSWG
jgi:hypothetical protein